MIILKKLKWSNIFSYGENNEIDFSSTPITQLVGQNGHGKSSIPMILEECIYNKNTKGIKKGRVLNRYSNSKSYKIGLTFSKDAKEYEISTTRASTQTVVLKENGVDISAHTATGTFKLIEAIMGIDHKSFTQLVYQSSGTSLEFLTATDTARKRFLIELLNLTRYTEILESLKVTVRSATESVSVSQRSVDMVNEWLKKNTSITLVEMELKEVPSQPSEMRDKVAELTQSVNTIKSTNKTITQNNTYKTGLNSINLDTAIQKLERPTTSIITLTQERGEHMKTVRDANTMLAKLRGLHGTCPTCMQEVSKEFIEGLISEHSTELANANSAIASLNAEMSAIEKILKQISEQEKLKESYEFYHGHYDASIPVDLLDENALRKEIDELNNLIAATLSSISEVEKYNKSAEANNAKVSVIQEQLEVMKQDLVKHTTELQACSARLADLQVLQKAFSTTGLIAYKIENLVKDLEELVNQYLAELSYGRFQITFRVESDKLNVIVHDNDFEVTMEELSKGEVARVNTATLLAIRKLMQDLSNTRINLLVLDETMDNLDADGKERLVELLLREHHLNTFIVSHGYSHPLLEKVTVVKEDNISRIENA